MSERRRVPAEIRNIVFPVSVRGYDRLAVDAYVTRVNRVIAELEATQSPQSAIQPRLSALRNSGAASLIRPARRRRRSRRQRRHEAEEMIAKARAEAVDIVLSASEEADRTKAEADEYSAKARTEGERILARSRTVAEDRLRRAEEEIASLRKEAEAWMRALRIDTNIIWGERRDLLDDLREIAARLQEAASHAGVPAGSHDGSSA